MTISALLPSELENEITDLGANDYLIAQKSGETRLSKLKIGSISPADVGAAPTAGDTNKDFSTKALTASGAVTGTEFKLSSNDKIAMYASNLMGFYVDGNIVAALSEASVFIPPADNTGWLGNDSFSWNQVWAFDTSINASDEKLKTDILDSDLGLDFITTLRPVSYKWRVAENQVSAPAEPGGAPIITPRPGVRRHYGLIAQEVKAALGDKDFAGYIVGANSGVQCLRYDEFISPLIKAVQELAGQVETLTARIKAIETP